MRVWSVVGQFHDSSLLHFRVKNVSLVFQQVENDVFSIAFAFFEIAKYIGSGKRRQLPATKHLGSRATFSWISATRTLLHATFHSFVKSLNLLANLKWKPVALQIRKIPDRR